MTEPIPSGSVVITSREIYDGMVQTKQALDRLTATIDPALTDIRTDATALSLRVDSNEAAKERHGNRLTKIETQLRAAWAVIGVVAATAGTLAAIIFPHHYH